jgi:CRP/FNR family transcriptional regulator
VEPIHPILRRVPLFSDFSEDELRSVAQRVAVTRHPAGKVLFNQGEKGGDLFVVAEGTVRILKTAANGRHQLLAIERAGSSLG